MYLFIIAFSRQPLFDIKFCIECECETKFTFCIFDKVIFFLVVLKSLFETSSCFLNIPSNFCVNMLIN